MSEADGPRATSPPLGGAESFLIVCLGGMGKVVNALPALHALRAAYPDSEIGWVVDGRLAALLGHGQGGHPELTRVHPVPRAEWRKLSWWGRRRAMREIGAALRPCRYAAVVDLHGDGESARVSRASGAGVRISYAPPEGSFTRRRFYTYRIVPGPAARHVSERNLSLLVPFGVRRDEPRCVLPDFSDARAHLGRSVKGINEDYAVFHAGSSWPSKRWPAESCAGLAERVVAELSLRVVLTAHGDDERSRAGEVAGRAGNGVAVAPELELDELAALVGGAKLFVGGETGPMHLAWASGVPTVAIFGPTRPERTGPRGSRSRAAHAGLDCLGCGQEACPRGTDACMKEVDPGAVFKLAREVVGRD